MREDTNLETRQNMLDYVIAMMDYANDFSCDAAKDSHAVLLCRIEQGQFKLYGEVDRIDIVWRATTHHETRGVMYKHIYSEGFTSFGNLPSTECQNKLKKHPK